MVKTTTIKELEERVAHNAFGIEVLSEVVQEVTDELDARLGDVELALLSTEDSIQNIECKRLSAIECALATMSRAKRREDIKKYRVFLWRVTIASAILIMVFLIGLFSMISWFL